MNRIIKALFVLLLLCGTAWGAVTTVDFDPDTHKGVILLHFDDWATVPISDSCEAHDIPVAFYLWHTTNATKLAAAQTAYLAGHSIGSHSMSTASLGALWQSPDQDSVKTELSDSRDFVENLIQAVDAEYECNTFVYPNNNSTPETDSLAFLYYDIVRGANEITVGDSTWQFYGYETPSYRTLYRHIPYYSPVGTDTISLTTSAEADTNLAGNISANIENLFDLLRDTHAIAVVNMHPSGDTLNELNSAQWTIFLDSLAAVDDIWVTTMDEVYAQLGSTFRGGASGDHRGYRLWADLYYDDGADAFGSGTSASPWTFPLAYYANIQAGERYQKNWYHTNIRLGAGSYTHATKIISYGQHNIYGVGVTTVFQAGAAGSSQSAWDFRKSTSSFWDETTTAGFYDLKLTAAGTNDEVLSTAVSGPTVDHIVVAGCTFEPEANEGAILIADDNVGNTIRECTFISASLTAYAIDVTSAGWGSDSTYFCNNVFKVSRGIRFAAPQRNHIYNNVMIPQHATDNLMINMQAYGDSTATNRVYYNLVSSQDNEDATPWGVAAAAKTFAQWEDGPGSWCTNCGDGTMPIADYMASPYTAISAAGDTVKWGGCQLGILPLRVYGFSSYGLTQWSQLPRIPERFATIADSDSLNEILSWCWVEGDTVILREMPSKSIPDNTDMELWLDVPLPSDFWRGGW